jgi:nucleotide-binding universal stress UspA family protein
MKTIIVPVDFLAVAQNAMWFAADMAQQVNAALLLLHVYQLPVTVSEAPLVMMSPEELKEDSEAGLQELKKKIESATFSKVPVTIEARMGSIGNVMQDICASVQPFAVVMGSKGAGRLERIVFGSNTLLAISHLHVPVLVIPPDVTFRPVQKIGLACDFRNVASTIPANEIKTIVKAFQAELHVLNIDSDMDHLQPSGREQTATLYRMLSELNPHFHFIVRENIDETLDEFARQNHIDFLIVVPKEHGFPEGLFHKSHAKQLALHAHVPVMAIHE